MDLEIMVDSVNGTRYIENSTPAEPLSSFWKCLIPAGFSISKYLLDTDKLSIVLTKSFWKLLYMNPIPTPYQFRLQRVKNAKTERNCI